MLNDIHSTFFFCNHVIAKALTVITQMIVALGKSCHGNRDYHERKMISQRLTANVIKKCRQLTTLHVTIDHSIDQA